MPRPDTSNSRGDGSSRRASTSQTGEEKSQQLTGHRDGKGKAAQQSERRRRPLPASSVKESGEVGASKIKAALRQTRRLLAKDKLSSDVRQEAERRLASLEADLARKELSEKERKNAERYHKVRFFERQKLVRQIKKIKKAIADQPEKKKKKLEEELRERRVLLNYVLHYPTSVKYVALFPSSGESPFDKPADTIKDTEQSRRARQTHESAMSVRKKVEASMKDGLLSQEPEMELERRAADDSSPSSTKRSRLDFGDNQKLTLDEREKKRKRKHVGENDGQAAADKAKGGIEEDDFFATRSDNE